MPTDDSPSIDGWWLVFICPVYIASCTLAAFIEAYMSFTQTIPDEAKKTQ